MESKGTLGQSLIDDTEALSCTLEAAQTVQGHTEYIIKVQRGIGGDRQWQVVRRYSDFAALHTALQLSGIELPLPPKKVFGNMDREFVAERQLGLQNYINTILAHPMLASSLWVKRFLDPDNYLVNFQELALQHVSMFFRSEPTWEVQEPLSDIGWRLRKQFFLVQNNSDAKQKYMLSWSEVGPDKFLDDKDLKTAMKALSTIKHPYIYSTVFASSSSTGSLAIRILNPVGSLRDHICNAKFRMPFLKKYGSPRSYTTLQVNEIRTYGKQILEALKFLQDKGFPYGHLHTGNILLEDGVCKISDLENQLLGFPSYYRPFAVQLRKIQTLEAIDVYAFGHVIYEMTFGEPLNSLTCETYPATCLPQIKSVLESILTTEAVKGGIPLVSDLLSHNLFRDVVLSVLERPQLKLPSQIRESLRPAKEHAEARLRTEQKQFRHVKRLSKAQAMLTSEEEKKKRKQLTKKKSQIVNGKEDSRPTSPNSNASTCSAPTPPPAPPSPVMPTAPLPPPPPLPAMMTNPGPPSPAATAKQAPLLPTVSTDRGALLGSIQGFNKSKLRKSEANDRSSPLG